MKSCYIIIVILLLFIIYNSNCFTVKNSNTNKENFINPPTNKESKPKTIKGVTFKETNVNTDKLIFVDKEGNMKTDSDGTSFTSGIPIKSWKIYEDASKNLCFIRSDLENVEPICMNGKKVSEGGGMITSPRNSTKAWVTFNTTSFADTGKDLHKYPSLTNVTKELTKQSTESTEPGWQDGYNIKKIERFAIRDQNRPDTYKIYFNTAMKDNKYSVYLGQGDPNGVPNCSWLNLLGVKNKTKEHVEIYIRGDYGSDKCMGAVVAPWYKDDKDRDFIISVMIYQ
jgi:hypothetical protein